MRPSDGVAWFLASAMLLLTVVGCGVFGLGALVLAPFDRIRDQSNGRAVVATATVMAPTATVAAPTVTVVVVQVAPVVTPTSAARTMLVLLPLVVGPAAATVTPDVMACVCSDDIYDCGDGEIAERCFDVCRGQGFGDVHNLDGNSNGDACED